ncbi:MAG TPA: hypothetical protein VKD71_14090, partial [Gemmataceae bacterium]|nr:hypothetical protein [Gemmataceae bacterium]
TAPSARIARLVADAAERTRKEQAMAWLGKELPRWSPPWPLTVTLSQGSAGGASSFDFSGPRVDGHIRVEGALDRLLTDVVPHEVTHCVMAEYFWAPVPRWADEGIALLSESEEERTRHQRLAQEAVKSGDFIQTKAFFKAKEYPTRSIAAFFAQGYWVTKVLVDRKDRPTFVAFVKDGMKDGWEPAAKKHYGYASLAELEDDYRRKLGASPIPASAAALRTAPQLAMASIDGEGRIKVYVPRTYYEPVTTYATRQVVVERDGKKETQSYAEPVTHYRLRSDTSLGVTFATTDVQAMTADGKSVEEKALLTALKDKPVAVVVATGRGGIDKAFAVVLKPDTLVLIVPAASEPSAPLAAVTGAPR